MENVSLFTEKRIIKAFCDGGLVSANPSEFGGTYGYCLVDENDELVSQGSGFVQSPDGLTTNNHTEMWAAIMALEALPSGWSGTLVSDSQITLGRLFSGWRNKNLPVEYVIRARKALERLGTVKAQLCGGHPTKVELENGVNKKGVTVSKWNVLCDLLCNEEVKKVKGIDTRL